ncbi:MAG: alpha/beta hydrolase, partial [Myxococcota bacterium]
MESLPPIEPVATVDGSTLGARFYTPAETPRGAVMIVPAMGVSQAYYASFARWLAREGYLAVTFDFRGVGASQHGSLRDARLDIFDWARDCAP